ncbi:MAG: metalloprotease [Halobacteriaceae archaeon]
MATGLTFSARELRDLLVAWLALGLAFALFFDPAAVLGVRTGGSAAVADAAVAVVASLGTVGVAFVVHELAHKVVAVRFGQVAAFRADYGMLALAVVGGLAGFVFAAPGAVVHRGRLTDRQAGLVALAGPAVNLALVAVFAPLALVAPAVGVRGVQVTLLLAAFNMAPVGPLDGRTVLDWSLAVHLPVTAVAGAGAVAAFLLA